VENIPKWWKRPNILEELLQEKNKNYSSLSASFRKAFKEDEQPSHSATELYVSFFFSVLPAIFISGYSLS
jgi:hypothetical protein